MFEGHNEITFSKETAYQIFSKFMTEFFQNPIKVKDITKDYNGIKIEFTADNPPEKTDEEPDADA